MGHIVEGGENGPAVDCWNQWARLGAAGVT
jgi:hypothetical protein